jgi:hypothetical protein
MPIKLGDIAGRTKKVPIKIVFEDRVETANIWYKPAKYTVELFAEFLGDMEDEQYENLSEEEMLEAAEQDSEQFINNAVSRAKEQADKIPKMLGELITRWDIVDDDGNELPTTYEMFASLDMPFLNTLLAAIMQDMNAERGTEGNEKSNNSKGGSRQRGSMVGARGGIR